MASIVSRPIADGGGSTGHRRQLRGAPASAAHLERRTGQDGATHEATVRIDRVDRSSRSPGQPRCTGAPMRDPTPPRRPSSRSAPTWSGSLERDRERDGARVGHEQRPPGWPRRPPDGGGPRGHHAHQRDLGLRALRRRPMASGQGRGVHRDAREPRDLDPRRPSTDGRDLDGAVAHVDRDDHGRDDRAAGAAPSRARRGLERLGYHRGVVSTETGPVLRQQRHRLQPRGHLPPAAAAAQADRRLPLLGAGRWSSPRHRLGGADRGRSAGGVVVLHAALDLPQRRLLGAPRVRDAARPAARPTSWSRATSGSCWSSRPWSMAATMRPSSRRSGS